jgi:hypothetical protein
VEGTTILGATEFRRRVVFLQGGPPKVRRKSGSVLVVIDVSCQLA